MAIEKPCKLCPTIYGSLAKEPVAFEGANVDFGISYFVFCSRKELHSSYWIPVEIFFLYNTYNMTELINV